MFHIKKCLNLKDIDNGENYLFSLYVLCSFIAKSRACRKCGTYCFCGAVHVCTNLTLSPPTITFKMHRLLFIMKKYNSRTEKAFSEAFNVSRHRKIDFESQILALFDGTVHQGILKIRFLLYS